MRGLGQSPRLSYGSNGSDESKSRTGRAESNRAQEPEINAFEESEVLELTIAGDVGDLWREEREEMRRAEGARPGWQASTHFQSFPASNERKLE